MKENDVTDSAPPKELLPSVGFASSYTAYTTVTETSKVTSLSTNSIDIPSMQTVSNYYNDYTNITSPSTPEINTHETSLHSDTINNLSTISPIKTYEFSSLPMRTAPSTGLPDNMKTTNLETSFETVDYTTPSISTTEAYIIHDRMAPFTSNIPASVYSSSQIHEQATSISPQITITGLTSNPTLPTIKSSLTEEDSGTTSYTEQRETYSSPISFDKSSFKTDTTDSITTISTILSTAGTASKPKYENVQIIDFSKPKYENVHIIEVG